MMDITIIVCNFHKFYGGKYRAKCRVAKCNGAKCRRGNVGKPSYIDDYVKYLKEIIFICEN